LSILANLLFILLIKANLLLLPLVAQPSCRRQSPPKHNRRFTASRMYLDPLLHISQAFYLEHS
jgi:hypothetical protein